MKSLDPTTSLRRLSGAADHEEAKPTNGSGKPVAGRAAKVAAVAEATAARTKQAAVVEAALAGAARSAQDELGANDSADEAAALAVEVAADARTQAAATAKYHDRLDREARQRSAAADDEDLF